MATVTIEYFGMSGSGATLTAAKKDAGAKIEKAMSGTYTPTVLTHRGYAVLVFREPNGWDHRIIAEPTGGIREGRVWGGCNYRTEEEATRAAKSHLAQLGWEPGDGLTPPAFLTHKDDIAEYVRQAKFYARFAAAKGFGLNPDEAHAWALGSFGRPDLAALPIACEYAAC